MPKKIKKVEQVIEPEYIANSTDPRGYEELDAPAGLVAYAPFEVNGEAYEAGDVFTPPAGWTRDDSFEEFRAISRKNKGAQEIGIAFAYAGEIIDRKTKERQTHRVVVPVKEA